MKIDREAVAAVVAVASTIQRDKDLSAWAYGGDFVAMWNRMAEWGLAFYDAFNSRLAKAKGEAQDDLNAAYLPALLRYPKLLSENLPMKTPRQVALMSLAEAVREV